MRTELPKGLGPCGQRAGLLRPHTRQANYYLERTLRIHSQPFLFITIPLMCILASILFFAACGGGESKEDILAQTWDCWAQGDTEVFEQSMLMTFPTANNMDEAKAQFIYVSSVAPIEDLKASRDEACGASPS